MTHLGPIIEYGPLNYLDGLPFLVSWLGLLDKTALSIDEEKDFTIWMQEDLGLIREEDRFNSRRPGDEVIESKSRADIGITDDLGTTNHITMKSLKHVGYIYKRDVRFLASGDMWKINKYKTAVQFDTDKWEIRK
ncbi:hypothetical protein HPP92_016190 [Vanilla planifolia]|uniref:Uncharacterized protein n=1 Tax=Vanilla planifolia TaxID=51239 RepID=A0A835QL13_VANPL|nr:hypothetical protein HPP92_016190 [Vanilla planifolia]